MLSHVLLFGPPLRSASSYDTKESGKGCFTEVTVPPPSYALYAAVLPMRSALPCSARRGGAKKIIW